MRIRLVLVFLLTVSSVSVLSRSAPDTLDTDHLQMGMQPCLSDRLPDIIGPVDLHGHPTKATYASPEEMPCVDHQAHWQPANAAGDLGHVHIGVRYPLYGRVSQPFRVPVSIKMFHIEGQIDNYELTLTGYFRATHNPVVPGSLIWDTCQCGSIPMADRIGDPHGLKEITGSFVIDPAQGGILHGWFPVDMEVRVQLTNGDLLMARGKLSLYSVVDTSVPPVGLSPEHDYLILASSTTFSLRTWQLSGLHNWGNQLIEFRHPLPVGTVTEPFVLQQTLGYIYGQPVVAGTPPGMTELRLDPALHSGNEGSVLAMAAGTVEGGSDGAVLTNTAILPPAGPHILMARWTKSTGAGTALVAANERADALLTIGIVSDPGGEPPPPPPPPPPVTWTPIDGTLQQGSDGSLRFCPAGQPESACFVVIRGV